MNHDDWRVALKELRYYSHFYGNSVMIPLILSENR
jgi:hypothetical protein